MSDPISAKKAMLKELIGVARKASAERLRSKHAPKPPADEPASEEAETPADGVESASDVGSKKPIALAVDGGEFDDQSADEEPLEGLPGLKRHQLKDLLKKMG